MRIGLENFVLDEARQELGFAGMVASIVGSCKDHEGAGTNLFSNGMDQSG